MSDGIAPFEVSITLGSASFNASGDPRQVMAALEQFTALVESGPREETADATDKADDSDRSGAGSGGKKVLPVFLSERGTLSNPMVATAIVAWSELHDSKASLTAPEIKRLWLSTSLKKPGNVNRDADSAAKDGLLHKEGKAYSVTGYGKQRLGLST